MAPTNPMITTMPIPKSASPSTDAARERAICVAGVSHAYGSRQALVDLSLEIHSGEWFAILGPNGGGKTTLFRLLSTLVPVQAGAASILGHDLATEATAIRHLIGVVFQSPSLDRKLTVAENIRLQASLYGLRGRELTLRMDELLARFSLSERAGELTERLSGGLRRRVELAKGMIHQPRVLLLDEPSAGLDPAARLELAEYLRRMTSEQGTTIVQTTHHLEEADGADRIAILNEGRLVALGEPDKLRSEVGGDSITIETDSPNELAAGMRAALHLEARVVDSAVRLEVQDGHTWISRIIEAFPGQVAAIRLGKPTLEDVFVARTGRGFWRQ
jgi:ABC-2 type transport system ATP-binding protein